MHFHLKMFSILSCFQTELAVRDEPLLQWEEMHQIGLLGQQQQDISK